MNIIFMGTPEWAVPSLQAVLDVGTEISTVITQPDRHLGRKGQLQSSPLKQFALEKKLSVHTPEKAGSTEILELVSSLAPELILVCAYGQILPQSFLDIPKIGSFNLHFSFLPQLRGASPVQAAIASGFKKTGVSLQKMVLRLDAGPLVAVSKPEVIRGDDTTPLLGSRLAKIGAQLIRDTLPRLISGGSNAIEQTETEATYCQIIKKEEGHVHWREETAIEIERKFRAFVPWPGIFSFYSMPGNSNNKQRLQLTKVEVVRGNFKPGEIYPEFIVGSRYDGLRFLRL